MMIDEVPMSVRVREFDSSGSIVQHARTLLELIGDDVKMVADTFVDSYVTAAGLGSKLTSANIENMRESAQRYVVAKLSALDGMPQCPGAAPQGRGDQPQRQGA
jgi:hypothetical protein